jgi:F0F1-type ATP synthase assembly protein I
MTQQQGTNGHSAPQSVTSAKVDGMNEGITVLAYLISGVAVYGVLGWLADRYLSTSFLLPIGIVLGAATGVYVIIRRFGQLGTMVDPPHTAPRSGPLRSNEGTDRK